VDLVGCGIFDRARIRGDVTRPADLRAYVRGVELPDRVGRLVAVDIAAFHDARVELAHEVCRAARIGHCRLCADRIHDVHDRDRVVVLGNPAVARAERFRFSVVRGELDGAALCRGASFAAGAFQRDRGRGLRLRRDGRAGTRRSGRVHLDPRALLLLRCDIGGFCGGHARLPAAYPHPAAGGTAEICCWSNCLGERPALPGGDRGQLRQRVAVHWGTVIADSSVRGGDVGQDDHVDRDGLRDRRRRARVLSAFGRMGYGPAGTTVHAACRGNDDGDGVSRVRADTFVRRAGRADVRVLDGSLGDEFLGPGDASRHRTDGGQFGTGSVPDGRGHRSDPGAAGGRSDP